jgi:hypothetical protein
MAAPDLDDLRDALLRWYGRARRDLPWRRTTDPYAILVSEVMLQQTQVARVVPRYLEWIERWPTAPALAAASRADVLAAWVGLGYNRRALALHAAATAVARDGWPEDLRDLPGVGPYTAAAVASFAFGAQVTAVDTNARRVAARLGRGAPDALLPAGRAAEWNQAAMGSGRRSARRGRRCAGRARWRRGALRRCGRRGRGRRGRGGRARHRGRPLRAPVARPSASRTRTAGSAGASSRRWRRGRDCPPTSLPTGSSGPSRGSCATGSSARSAAGSR